MARTTFNEQLTRIAVGGYDDAQEMRKSAMNRVRDIIRKKNEDIPFDEVEEEKEDKSYDSKYDDDNLPDIVEEMVDEGKLDQQEWEYLQDMLEAASMAEEIEDQYESVLKTAKREPIYQDWLNDVYGVSHILTARLVNMFGYCEQVDHVSDLWSYCGMAPGQSRERGEQLGFNPEAKKLAWLVSDSMIKQGSRSQYRVEFYDTYKEKQLRRMDRAEEMTEAELEDVKWTPPESEAHADNRARRYLAKKFLKHYCVIARDMKGIETPDEWVLKYGGHEKKKETFENPFYAKRQIKG